MHPDNPPSLLDELEDEHRSILERILEQKLIALEALPYGRNSDDDWALLALLHDLGLIADELRRMGPRTDDVPF